MKKAESENTKMPFHISQFQRFNSSYVRIEEKNFRLASPPKQPIRASSNITDEDDDDDVDSDQVGESKVINVNEEDREGQELCNELGSMEVGDSFSLGSISEVEHEDDEEDDDDNDEEEDDDVDIGTCSQGSKLIKSGSP